MKSQAMQELVKKIFGNEETKAQFIANPESVISNYNLTEQEKRAVLNTCAKLGVVTAGSPELTATMARAASWAAPEALSHTDI